MRKGNYGEKTDNIEQKYVINEKITARQVRLIGLEGNQLGVVNLEDALRRAEEAGVDLVQVAAEASPPVCRLLDFGKLKYREQKKAAEARKHSATHSVKEIRVRYSTDKHDLETKVRMARRFIDDGDKVKFQMRFRGREVTYEQLGQAIFDQLEQMLGDISVVEQRTPLLGQIITITFAPKGMAKQRQS